MFMGGSFCVAVWMNGSRPFHRRLHLTLLKRNRFPLVASSRGSAIKGDGGQVVGETLASTDGGVRGPGSGVYSDAN